MKKKKIFQSKEVWVLGMAVLIALSEYLGVDFDGVTAEATSLWVGAAPLVALILRVFFTDSKITK